MANRGMTAAALAASSGLGAATSDGSAWTLWPTPNQSWRDIAFGAGLFVAVASNGSIMTSPEGKAWTSRTGVGNKYWNRVIWNGTIFVALEDNNNTSTIMTSPNGIDWTLRTTPLYVAWSAIAWGAGLFVAVASSGGFRAMISSNGADWALTVTPEGYWDVIYWNGTVFVALGSLLGVPRSMTSTDGLNWTIRSRPAGDFLNMTSNGSIFVAIGGNAGGNIAISSPNGIDWTTHTMPSNSNPWLDLSWNGSVFATVTTNDFSQTTVATSTDGALWELQTIPLSSGYYWRTIASNGTIFVALSDQAMAMVSDLNLSIQLNQQRIVYFIELHFSTIERATTWARDLTWGGNTYLAGGNLLTLPDIEESVEIRSSSASVVLSGVNQANIAIALTENFIDKRMVIMRGFIGDNDQLIIDPVIQFDGRVDSWSLTEDADQGTSTITWVAASHWIDFERTSGRTTNDKEHQVIFPGDKFFEFSGETVDIKWGTA